MSMTMTTNAPVSKLGFFDKLRMLRVRRRVYRQTFAELAGLSDRELSDIGIGRSEIRRISLEAAEMA